MKKNVILLIILIISGLLYAADPVVENVRVEQRTDGSLLVDVYYDVADADGDTLIIFLLASNDNGETWELPIVSVNGDTGKNVIPGADKHIVWDFLADNPNVSGDGFQVKVIAMDSEQLVDIDGNVYKTIKIGDQVWMAENLKVTHYRNGDDIDYISNINTWKVLSSGAYCYFDNDIGNAVDYGALYNSYAVTDSRNIAPPGWHVPTDDDWKKLEKYLGMDRSEAEELQWRGTDEGNKLKATSGWHDDGNGTNESGFSALPGGYRNGYNGGFYDMGKHTYYWTATEENYFYTAWYRILYYGTDKICRNTGDKKAGYSIRLVRDY